MKNKKTYLILAGVGALGIFLWMRGRKQTSPVSSPVSVRQLTQQEMFSQYKITGQITKFTPVPTQTLPKIDNDPLNIPLDFREKYISGDSMGLIFKPVIAKYNTDYLTMQI